MQDFSIYNTEHTIKVKQRWFKDPLLCHCTLMVGIEEKQLSSVRVLLTVVVSSPLQYEPVSVPSPAECEQCVAALNNPSPPVMCAE